MNVLKKTYLIIGILYIFSAKGYLEVSDTFYSVQTAKSIVERGELKLNVPAAKMYTIQGRDGAVYSKYGIGLAVYYVPFVSISKLISTWSHLSESAITGFLISFANLPFMFLFVFTFVNILKHFKVNSKYFPLMVFCLGIGSIYWRYTVYDFSEIQQASLLLICIYGMLINTNKSAFTAGSAFSFLILLKVFSIIYMPFILLYFFLNYWKDKNLRIVFAFFIPLTFTLLILLFLNYIRFGSPFETGYGDETRDFVLKQLPRTIPALLFSIDKGLLFYCPIIIFAFWGWSEFFKHHFNIAICILLIIIVNFLTTAAWWSWYGGWSWGPRLLIPVMGLWCIPISFWLKSEYSIVKRNILVVILVAGFVFQLPGILVKDQEIHHIKEMVFNLKEEKLTPTDFQMSWFLLFHKLKSNKEIYHGADFGVVSKGVINLEEFDTYQGFNIWTEQLSKFFNKPKIRWFLFLGIILIFIIIFSNKIRQIFGHEKNNLANFNN